MENKQQKSWQQIYDESHQNGWLLLQESAKDEYNEHGIIAGGAPEDIREVIEELLEQHYGFFVSLQENDDDEEPRIYLHTDNEEDMSQEDLDTLDVDDIAVNKDVQSQAAIFKLLGIEIRRVA